MNLIFEISYLNRVKSTLKFATDQLNELITTKKYGYLTCLVSLLVNSCNRVIV